MIESWYFSASISENCTIKVQSYYTLICFLFEGLAVIAFGALKIWHLPGRLHAGTKICCFYAAEPMSAWLGHQGLSST